MTLRELLSKFPNDQLISVKLNLAPRIFGIYDGVSIGFNAERCGEEFMKTDFLTFEIERCEIGNNRLYILLADNF